MSDYLAALRKDRDAFGHQVMDYYLDPSEEHIEIIERRDGLINASSPIKNYFRDYPDWPAFEQQAMKELRPGRVLDIGSGAGRVELYLESRGFAVTGIDNSPLAVEVCRRRGAKDVRVLPVEKLARDTGMFENITMMGNNWGLMANPRQARRLLRLFHRITTPDARIVATSNDIYQTENPLHLAHQQWNRDRGRMSGQIRLRVRHGMHSSPWFDYLMVSPDEMREILAGTGWQLLRIIPSEGSSYAAILEKDR